VKREQERRRAIRCSPRTRLHAPSAAPAKAPREGPTAGGRGGCVCWLLEKNLLCTANETASERAASFFQRRPPTPTSAAAACVQRQHARMRAAAPA
jgi:hypothetical protein